MTAIPLAAPAKLIELTIDGQATRVPDGTTLLQACRGVGIDTPTLCYLETLTPVNVCRVCVVEVKGSRVLAPACSRTVEEGMEALLCVQDEMNLRARTQEEGVIIDDHDFTDVAVLV